MNYFSTDYRDRPFLGPRDVGRPVGVCRKPGETSGVGVAHGWSCIPRDYDSGRPAEMLWKLQVGKEDLPGLWTLRMGKFHRHDEVEAVVAPS